MRRFFSHPILALAAGLCLRLFFVLKFPGESGDTPLYEEIAGNWLKEHAYATGAHGALTPVDVRMPGYPAFLALIYAITGSTGESARLWAMIAQVGIDLISCCMIAALCCLLAPRASAKIDNKRVFTMGLWLAALCPFTANYVAVPLTEVFVVLLTAAALIVFVLQFLNLERSGLLSGGYDFLFHRKSQLFGVFGGLCVGLATLFRPESPLLLVPAWITLGWAFFRKKQVRLWLRCVILSGIACVIPLAPWAIRNAITLHEVQFLTPKYSNAPGELVPYGFMAWEKTWLYRMRDCYAVPWKLNVEEIKVEEIPAPAFDSPEEKRRIEAVLKQYNSDLTLTKTEDDAFGQIARERTQRQPLRTYLWIPAARFVAMWFTPRIELLPISGNVFPLAKMREVDPEDQEFTILLFFLNVFYLGLGAWGVLRLWRSSAAVRPLVSFLILFVLLRTAFLTTLETPEPRYVLVCFPVVLALAAQPFAGKPEPQPSN